MTQEKQLWTRQRIYRLVSGDPGITMGLRRRISSMPPHFSQQLLRALKEGRRNPEEDNLTDELVSAIKDEKWLPPEERTLMGDEIIPVVKNKVSCPICDGIGYYDALFTGATTEIDAYFQRKCICQFYRLYYSMWGDPGIAVPPRFSDVKLGTMVPSPLNKMTATVQQEIIQRVRHFPRDCYFIYGPAGIGKTHLSIALLEKAIETWAWNNFRGLEGQTLERIIFRVSTKTWVDEMFAFRYQDRQVGKASIPPPTLNVDTIRRLANIPGVHIFVIFDEIDKFNPTEPRMLELFEITNALSEVKAQLIATSNHSPDALRRRWNSGHSDAILRRFYDSTGGEPRHLLGCTIEGEENPGQEG
jgi:hypothetical protein